MQIIFTAVLLLTLCSNSLFAQCSDAGVCAIGSRHALLGHRVSASYVFGTSGKTDDLTIHSIHIEGSIQLFRWQIFRPREAATQDGLNMLKSFS